jgi:SAM-dependent methyltransferase
MTDVLARSERTHPATPLDPKRGEMERRRALAQARRAAWDECKSWRDPFEEVLGRERRRVLEVECRDADATFLLYVLGHEVHGTDESPERVRRVTARADAACAAAVFRRSDPEDLKFPPRVFDAVHARDLLSKAARPGLLLLEWYRVLRAGGTALVVESDGGVRPAELLRLAGFAGVQQRVMRLPRRCMPRVAREPWYRRLAVRTAPFQVAWGTRQ